MRAALRCKGFCLPCFWEGISAGSPMLQHLGSRQSCRASGGPFGFVSDRAFCLLLT